jgi:hypothetical protein
MCPAVPQALYGIDPQLNEHRDHIEYRWNQYKSVRENIIKAHGSLEEFARVSSSTALHCAVLSTASHAVLCSALWVVLCCAGPCWGQGGAGACGFNSEVVQ